MEKPFHKRNVKFFKKIWVVRSARPLGGLENSFFKSRPYKITDIAVKIVFLFFFRGRYRLRHITVFRVFPKRFFNNVTNFTLRFLPPLFLNLTFKIFSFLFRSLKSDPLFHGSSSIA